MRSSLWSVARAGVLVFLSFTAVASAQQPVEPAKAKAKDAVVWPGLTPSGSVLLPNGWSLKPVGRQTPLGELPITLAEHPGEPVLAVLHAGYGEHEVVTLDAKTARVIARVAVPETYGGLAWSADGAQLFVGGGFDEVVYRFDHARGFLSNRGLCRFMDRSRRAPASGPSLCRAPSAGPTRPRGRSPAWRRPATAPRSGSPTRSRTTSSASI